MCESLGGNFGDVRLTAASQHLFMQVYGVEDEATQSAHARFSVSTDVCAKRLLRPRILGTRSQKQRAVAQPPICGNRNGE